MSKYEGVLKMFNININFLKIFNSLRIFIRPPSIKGTTHIKDFSNHKSQNIMNYKPATHKECVVRYSDLVAPKSGSRLKKEADYTQCVSKKEADYRHSRN